MNDASSQEDTDTLQQVAQQVDEGRLHTRAAVVTTPSPFVPLRYGDLVVVAV